MIIQLALASIHTQSHPQIQQLFTLFRWLLVIILDQTLINVSTDRLK